MSIFLWKDKALSISLKSLQKTKDKGSLVLLSFHNYVLAIGCNTSQSGKHSPLEESWLAVEQRLCNNKIWNYHLFTEI